MRREDLEHLIRAAGAISGSRRIVVIGSQAILGQFPYQAPVRATRSVEADLLPIDAPDKTELLTGSLGELSPFHDTYGYFGDGVSLETARLPRHWQDRLIIIDNPNTNGYIGLCLEVHDLLISKYFAGRARIMSSAAPSSMPVWSNAICCSADWLIRSSNHTITSALNGESPLTSNIHEQYR